MIDLEGGFRRGNMFEVKFLLLSRALQPFGDESAVSDLRRQKFPENPPSSTIVRYSQSTPTSGLPLESTKSSLGSKQRRKKTLDTNDFLAPSADPSAENCLCQSLSLSPAFWAFKDVRKMLFPSSGNAPTPVPKALLCFVCSTKQRRPECCPRVAAREGQAPH